MNIFPRGFKPYSSSSCLRHKFFQIPKNLFVNPKYKLLSSNAKLLYSIILDRVTLSIKNKWIDRNGYVYLILCREEAMKLMNISKVTAVKTFKELSSCGLIYEKRSGFSKPYIIYIGIMDENITTCSNLTHIDDSIINEDAKTDDFNDNIGKESIPMDDHRYRNCTYIGKETIPIEVKKLYPINTDIINTELIDTYTSDRLDKKEIILNFKNWWNKIANKYKFNSIDNINPKLERLIIDQKNEGLFDNLDNIEDCIDNSSFLKGKISNSKWKLNFYWIICNSSNWKKIIEGLYEDANNINTERRVFNRRTDKDKFSDLQEMLK